MDTLSPQPVVSTSRYGRTRKPKQNSDSLYDTDFTLKHQRAKQQSPKRSTRLTRHRSRVDAEASFIHVTGDSCDEDDVLGGHKSTNFIPNVASLPTSSAVVPADLERQFRSITPEKQLIRSRSRHVSRKFFKSSESGSPKAFFINKGTGKVIPSPKSRPKTVEPDLVDVRKVMQIISSKPTHQFVSPPADCKKGPIKTYRSKRKVFTEDPVYETFGLPDVPFVNVSEKSSAKSNPQIDVDLTKYDKSLLTTVPSTSNRSSPDTNTFFGVKLSPDKPVMSRIGTLEIDKQTLSTGAALKEIQTETLFFDLDSGPKKFVAIVVKKDKVVDIKKTSTPVGIFSTSSLVDSSIMSPAPIIINNPARSSDHVPRKKSPINIISMITIHNESSLNTSSESEHNYSMKSDDSDQTIPDVNINNNIIPLELQSEKFKIQDSHFDIDLDETNKLGQVKKDEHDIRTITLASVNNKVLMANDGSETQSFLIENTDEERDNGSVSILSPKPEELPSEPSTPLEITSDQLKTHKLVEIEKQQEIVSTVEMKDGASKDVPHISEQSDEQRKIENLKISETDENKLLTVEKIESIKHEIRNKISANSDTTSLVSLFAPKASKRVQKASAVKVSQPKSLRVSPRKGRSVNYSFSNFTNFENQLRLLESFKSSTPAKKDRHIGLIETIEKTPDFSNTEMLIKATGSEKKSDDTSTMDKSEPNVVIIGDSSGSNIEEPLKTPDCTSECIIPEIKQKLLSKAKSPIARVHDNNSALSNLLVKEPSISVDRVIGKYQRAVREKQAEKNNSSEFATEVQQQVVPKTKSSNTKVQNKISDSKSLLVKKSLKSADLVSGRQEKQVDEISKVVTCPSSDVQEKVIPKIKSAIVKLKITNTSNLPAKKTLTSATHFVSDKRTDDTSKVVTCPSLQVQQKAVSKPKKMKSDVLVKISGSNNLAANKQSADIVIGKQQHVVPETQANGGSDGFTSERQQKVVSKNKSSSPKVQDNHFDSSSLSLGSADFVPEKQHESSEKLGDNSTNCANLSLDVKQETGTKGASDGVQGKMSSAPSSLHVKPSSTDLNFGRAKHSIVSDKRAGARTKNPAKPIVIEKGELIVSEEELDVSSKHAVSSTRSPMKSTTKQKLIIGESDEDIDTQREVNAKSKLRSSVVKSPVKSIGRPPVKDSPNPKVYDEDNVAVVEKTFQPEKAISSRTTNEMGDNPSTKHRKKDRMQKRSLPIRSSPRKRGTTESENTDDDIETILSENETSQYYPRANKREMHSTADFGTRNNSAANTNKISYADNQTSAIVSQIHDKDSNSTLNISISGCSESNNPISTVIKVIEPENAIKSKITKLLNGENKLGLKVVSGPSFDHEVCISASKAYNNIIDFHDDEHFPKKSPTGIKELVSKRRHYKMKRKQIMPLFSALLADKLLVANKKAFPMPMICSTPVTSPVVLTARNVEAVPEKQQLKQLSPVSNANVFHVKKEEGIYGEGDLVWARIGCHPFWPAMVCKDPDEGEYQKNTANQMAMLFHVRFFADNGRRAWVRNVAIMHYSGRDDLDNAVKKVVRLKQANAGLIIKRHHRAVWSMAVDELESVRLNDLSTKLAFFEDVMRTPVVYKGKDKVVVSKPKATVAPRVPLTAKPAELTENTLLARSRLRDRLSLCPKAVDVDTATMSDDVGKDKDLTKAVSPPLPVSGGILLPNLAERLTMISREATPSESCSSDTDSGTRLRRSGPMPCNMEYLENLYKRNKLFKNVTKEKVCELCWKTDTVDQCKGCFRYYHERCTRLGGADVDGPNEASSRTDFLCEMCVNKTNVCFVCRKGTTDKGDSNLMGCLVSKCGYYFHRACMRLWPQTFWSDNSPSITKTITTTLTCPRHVCHLCVSEDPKGSSGRFTLNENALVRCVVCPAAYHANVTCVPAGSTILSATQLVCPRHTGGPQEPLEAKHMTTVNTNWCFLCSKGGNLICCETCPTSVHENCLTAINSLENGAFVCEDCETGRLTLYDEVVWVKMGNYRWWPAVVLFPGEVPDNIQNIRHRRGEFVVKFFGTYDHSWVSRPRLFLYHEGDRGNSSISNTNRFAVVYERAISEAAAAFNIRKEYKTTLQPSNLLRRKPSKYTRIRVNKPVGNVRTVDSHTSVTLPCSCDPQSDTPCGPDAQCLNRILSTECDPTSCPAGARCHNQRFEKRLYPSLQPFETQGRGWGLRSPSRITEGQFIIEYVGELIDMDEYRRRVTHMRAAGERNYYFLNVDSERMIDAGPKGNLARFMNHSCAPNCETQKWTVAGDTRVGIFARSDIEPNVELTFNYNLESFSDTQVQCQCGSKGCSGFIEAKNNKPGSVLPESDDSAIPTSSKKRKRDSDNVCCFLCNNTGGKTLVCCKQNCKKTYHIDCVETHTPNEKWKCPRHICILCNKRAIALCKLCPTSFCSEHIEILDENTEFVCKNHKDAVNGAKSKQVSGKSPALRGIKKVRR